MTNETITVQELANELNLGDCLGKFKRLVRDLRDEREIMRFGKRVGIHAATPLALKDADLIRGLDRQGRELEGLCRLLAGQIA